MNLIHQLKLSTAAMCLSMSMCVAVTTTSFKLSYVDLDETGRPLSVQLWDSHYSHLEVNGERKNKFEIKPGQQVTVTLHSNHEIAGTVSPQFLFDVDDRIREVGTFPIAVKLTVGEARVVTAKVTKQYLDDTGYLLPGDQREKVQAEQREQRQAWNQSHLYSVLNRNMGALLMLFPAVRQAAEPNFMLDINVDGVGPFGNS